ncbi:hypothetical protein BASA62_006458 [Batrachochytrium salamandrivorans]|nr:hypothetical protein BASA62_006458 [Batrachochytrium salamandrivorans]
MSDAASDIASDALVATQDISPSASQTTSSRRHSTAPRGWNANLMALVPHFVNITLHKCCTIAQISLYLDYKQDESYTPQTIAISAGSRSNDLHLITTVNLVKPEGWIHIPVSEPDQQPIRAFMLRVAVLSNHQGGIDTHIRLIRIYRHKDDGTTHPTL